MVDKQRCIARRAVEQSPETVPTHQERHERAARIKEPTGHEHLGHAHGSIGEHPRARARIYEPDRRVVAHFAQPTVVERATVAIRQNELRSLQTQELAGRAGYIADARPNRDNHSALGVAVRDGETDAPHGSPFQLSRMAPQPSGGGRRPPPEPTAILRGHRHDVSVLTFAVDDADVLYSGDVGGNLLLWSLRTRRARSTIGHAHGDKGIVGILSLPGARLLTTGRDGTVRMWDVASEAPTAVVPTGSGHFCDSAVVGDADAMTFAIPTADAKTWAMVDLRAPGRNADGTGADVPGMAFERKDDGGMCMSLSRAGASGHAIAAGYEDGRVLVWDVRAPQGPASTSPQLHTGPVFGVAVSADGTQAASGAADGHVCHVALPSYERLATHALRKDGTARIALRDDERVLAAAGWDGRVRLYDWRKRRALAVLKYHTGAVYGLAHSPHETGRFASGATDRRIALWDVYG